MAMLKFGTAAVATPIVCPGKWVDKKVTPGRIVVAKQVIAKYDPSKYLLSHATIMASVDVDQADSDDPKSNYLIKPPYSIFVNNNGDSWERELLRAASKSFIGADNYVEHVQISDLSKGKVIDVALREVPFTKDQDGKDLTSLYVDILIATDRKHKDIIDKIVNGEYSALSMGCLIAFSRCSQCGRTIEDESQACKHVRYFKNNTFLDKNGQKRIVAELCGDKEKPESCKFIDASWVRKPAFEGAVLRNLVEPGADVSEKLQKAVSSPSFEYAPGMYLKAASAAAKAIVNEIEAADEKKPELPKDDIGFPPASPEGDAPPADAPPSDAPPADAPPADAPPADAPPADAPPADTAPAEGAGGASLGGKMGEPPAPETTVEEPKADATVQELKDMVKKQLMNQIRRELLKDQAGQGGASPRPVEMENASNNSLVKQASLKSLIADTKRMGNHRLYNGLMILANLKDWKEFKKYGYTKNDVLGILHYMDTKLSSQPVGKDAVKAISKMKIASGSLVPFFTEVIVETGRKPDRNESRKMASWVKILSKFDK